MKKFARGTESATIQAWEESVASLANTVARFFDLSVLLESEHMTAGSSSNNLVSRIDPSLQLLSTTLDGQLTQARLALARTRNRATQTRSILRLPGEILTDIFIKFVHDPHGENRFSTILRMDLRVELIYRRIHCLLGVCTTWRNIAIACAPLWSLVPIVDPTNGLPRLLSTELSLQRAGNCDLHLVVSKPPSVSPRLDAVIGHSSRFQTVNIWSDATTAYEIFGVLDSMMRQEGLSSVSRLSLKHENPGSFYSDTFNNPFTNLKPQFLECILSLSALRIGNISITWSEISFSKRLTELWISDIVLDEPDVLGFFSALASAIELHSLAIISTQAKLGDHTPTTLGTMSFPKLRSLHLESLHFNFLDLLLGVISPGPYLLTLSLDEKINWYYPSDEMAAEDDICALLKRRPVHKLILTVEEECFWEAGEGLSSMLRSVPLLKILVLNWFDMTPDVIRGLIPPSEGQGSSFPKLDILEIHASSFSSPFSTWKSEFVGILCYHPIQKMVLGGDIEGDPDTGRLTPLGENDEIIPWLKTIVSQVYISPDADYAPESSTQWQLWDI